MFPANNRIKTTKCLKKYYLEGTIMSNSNNASKKSDAMNRFKMECASEVGVSLKDGYNGDLTSRENGSVGGQMTKKLVEAQMNQMAGK
jgi:hypothetical protein